MAQATQTASKLPLPPGPKGLPIVGSLPHIWRKPYVKIAEYARKYGDVMLIRLANEPTVVISHPAIMRDAFRLPELSDRLDDDSISSTFSPEVAQMLKADLIFGDYDERWRQLQRYAQRNILSRSRTEVIRETYVLPMMDFMLRTLDEIVDSGEPFYPTKTLSWVNARTITDIIYGVGGLSYHGPITNRVEEFMDIALWATGNMSIRNLGRYVPARLTRLVPGNHITMAAGAAHAIKGLLDMDLRLSSEGLMSIFDIDHPTCLMEIMMRDVRDGVIEPIHLNVLITDLMITGTDTSTNTVSWLIHALANNPDIQERVHAELKAYVDKTGDDDINMDAMEHLPYTFAAITENLRYSSVLPFAVNHRARTDCEVDGYTIPKGTQVLPNLWGVHRDERFWDNPEEFNPERFMPQADGSPSPNLENEGFMPFGVGRRACPGQNLARTTIWLQTARLFLHYRFEAPPGGLDDKEDFGLTLRPAPFKVRITRR